jgi:hypothetical protein
MSKIDEIKNLSIEELKEKYPSGKLIDFGDGEWAFFKKPTRQVVSMAMQKSRSSPMGLVEVIVANCLVQKSNAVVFDRDDEAGYLVGLAEVVDAIIGTKKAEVKN